MGKKLLWAFYLQTLLLATAAQAATPSSQVGNNGNFSPPANSAPNTGSAGAAGSATGGGTQQTRPTINVPTPGSIPAPSTTQQQQPVLGQFRTAKGETRIGPMLQERYKESVVRINARDSAGNILAQAMGVAVGKNNQYIATPLSIVLGSSQQWADKIEVVHASGNRYFSKIALIDEERNIVLLAPETNPAPIPLATEGNERPQIDIYAFSFELNPDTRQMEAKIKKGKLSAANSENGLLSVAELNLPEDAAGTGILNAQGELVGMLLPGGRGVLGSMITKLMVKAQRATPIEPIMIGAILGRGVLVDPKTSGAYKTISEALAAIKKGEAPKADTNRFIPATSSAIAPKKADKIVIKLMPGTYKEEKTINVPSNISISGAGPKDTHVFGANAKKPVFLIQNAENVMLSGLRITPAPLQSMEAPAVIVSKSNKITLLGNVLESKGGVAVWAHQSNDVQLLGNAFARSTARAVSCDRTTMLAEANSFLGDWPIAISADKGCTLTATRNLFYENKQAIQTNASITSLKLMQNSFIRTGNAIKLASLNTWLKENLFFECNQAIYSFVNLDRDRMERNAIWRSKISLKGKPMISVNPVRTEPKFEEPEIYDFRVKPGAQSGIGSEESDIGAYQQEDLLGPYTQQFVNTLYVVTGDDSLAKKWAIR